MTLTEKLNACFESDEPGGFKWAMDRVGEYPADAGELDTRELDLRDWGLYYGVAYGIGLDPTPALTPT